MSTLECVCIEIWFLSDELNGFFKKKSPGPIFVLGPRVFGSRHNRKNLSDRPLTMCTHIHTRRHNNGALYTPREKKNLIPARNGKKRMEKWKSKCESEYKLPTQKLRGVSMSSCWVERGIDIHPPREEEPHHCLDCGYIESRQVIFPFFFSPSLTAIGEVEKLQIQI